MRALNIAGWLLGAVTALSANAVDLPDCHLSHAPENRNGGEFRSPSASSVILLEQAALRTGRTWLSRRTSRC